MSESPAPAPPPSSYPTTISHGNQTKHILPSSSLFVQLLTLAARPSLRAKPAITDHNVHPPIQQTLAALLSDAIHIRGQILSALDASTISLLFPLSSVSSRTQHTRPQQHHPASSEGEEEGEVYIHLLAPGGWAFAAGILAILSLGAACSPLSPSQPLPELAYYARQTRAVGVVTCPSTRALGESLTRALHDDHDNASSVSGSFAHVPLATPPPPTAHIPPSSIVLSTIPPPPTSPALVIFTSGTTGPPKAAVLPLSAITTGASSLASSPPLALTPADILLHVLPVHHATGVWVSFFPFLTAGAAIEFRSVGGFDPAWVWARWRRGGVTCFSGVPTVYMRMMRWFCREEGQKGVEGVRGYRNAAAGVRVMMCGTSALVEPVERFWRGVRRGRSIVQRYGSTEMGVVLSMAVEQGEEEEEEVEIVPDGSVGEVVPGVDVRLSEEPGWEGELLVRSFSMFSKYLGDPEATRKAFDGDGYFRSGDLARREGKYFFIVGRASVDIIKSGGYKISALDVEREILALPFAAECMVVGVADEEFGQRVGCVVSLRDEQSGQGSLSGKGRNGRSLTLDNLRSAVRERLASYKLPTLLRVIEGELPKSATGKIVKKQLGPLYFPSNYAECSEVQIWNRDSALRRPKL